jgi:hypothetical protein
MRPVKLFFDVVCMAVTATLVVGMIKSPTASLSPWTSATDLIKHPSISHSGLASASPKPNNTEVVIVGSGYNGTIDCGAFGMGITQALEGILAIQKAYNAKSKAFREQRKNMEVDGFVENGRISLPCLWNQIKLAYYSYDLQERVDSIRVGDDAIDHLKSFCWASEGAVAESKKPMDIKSVSTLLQLGPESVNGAFKGSHVALYSVFAKRLAIQQDLLETCGCWVWEPNCKILVERRVQVGV